MIDLCQYKNAFGELNKGIHSYKLFYISVLDVLITVVIAYLISFFYNISFPITLGVLFLLGILVHRLFCVRTTVDKLLFPHLD